MSVSVPEHCANPECREPSIRPIHQSSQAVAIDAVDGPPVLAHHIIYRCSQCGHTWGVRGHSATRYEFPAIEHGAPMREKQTVSRGQQ